MAVSAKIVFAWYDYAIFLVLFFGCVITGIYFGRTGSNRKTIQEYLLGGKQLKPVPVAFSLAVSQFSGIAVIGIPGEIYKYGTTYLWAVIILFLSTIVAVYVFIPVYYELQVISVFDYLEKRFDRRTRLLGCLFQFVHDVCLPSVGAFATSLALSTATGINVFLIIFLSLAICVFYTALGGLKTVVWTDVPQLIVIFSTLVFVIVVSTRSTGGIQKVWHLAEEGGRLDILDFDPDPTKRDSFWIIVFGFGALMLSMVSTQQTSVQRFLSLPSQRDFFKLALSYGFTLSAIYIFLMIIGLIMYARYSSCDPLSSKQVLRHDQLVPYFILDVAQNVPGISGLFIATLFCAWLSSMSTVLNSFSAIIYKDYFKLFFKGELDEKRAHKTLKFIVLIEGCICLALAFLVPSLKEIFTFVLTLASVMYGQLLGMFILGMLIPKANACGTFFGALTSFVVVLCIAVPSRYYQLQGLLNYPSKPFSVEGCNMSTTFNISSGSTSTFKTSSEVPWIFRVSFLYTSLIGTVVAIVVGVIISYATNKDDPPVDRTLLSPVSRYFIGKSSSIANHARYVAVTTQTQNIKSDDS